MVDDNNNSVRREQYYSLTVGNRTLKLAEPYRPMDTEIMLERYDSNILPITNNLATLVNTDEDTGITHVKTVRYTRFVESPSKLTGITVVEFDNPDTEGYTFPVSSTEVSRTLTREDIQLIHRNTEQLYTDITKKLSKQVSASYAGKYLRVGSDGTIGYEGVEDGEAVRVRPAAGTAVAGNHDPVNIDAAGNWVKDEDNPLGIYDADTGTIVISGAMGGWSGLKPGTQPTKNTVALTSSRVLVLAQSTYTQPPIVYSLQITLNGQDAPAVVSYSGFAATMTPEERRELVRSHARHVLVVDGKISKYLNPNDVSKDIDGHSVQLDGSQGDVMLAYDPFWYKTTYAEGFMGQQIITINFAWHQFAADAVTPHQFGNQIAKHLCVGVFPALFDSSGLRSVKLHWAPIQDKKFTDHFANAAMRNEVEGVAGHQYNMTSPLAYAMHRILTLFDLGTVDFASIMGYGTVEYKEALSPHNGFDVVKPWCSVPSTVSEFEGRTICGLHNAAGNQYEFLADTCMFGLNMAYSVVGGVDGYNPEATPGVYPPGTWSLMTPARPLNPGRITSVITGKKYLPFEPATTSEDEGASALLSGPVDTVDLGAPHQNLLCAIGSAYTTPIFKAGLFCSKYGIEAGTVSPDVTSRLSCYILDD